MKLIQTGVIGVCLFASTAVHSQTQNDTAQLSPAAIVKDKEPVSKGEKKKKEYKSKEWQQGNEVITDTAGAPEKPKLPMRRKAGKRLPPPPPPPLPAAPPRPSEKK